MSPSLALFITLVFVAMLFYRDFREKSNVSSALWLPFLWVFISGARFVSEWLASFGFQLGGNSADEGSPLDAIFFFGLISTAVSVLYRRRVSLLEFIRHNRWFAIFLAYCLVAILWSDYPLMSFKRWIKLVGQPVMVLIILTEPDPMEALIRLFKRIAYVWIPFSLLFIRYFPALGRGFDPETGGAMNDGVTENKNMLGFDCMFLGFFFLWYFLRVWPREKNVSRRNEVILCLGFMIMIVWLIKLAHCSTAIGAGTLAVAVMLSLGLKFVNPRRVGFYLATTFVICALLEGLFGIHELVLQALGRNSTLTGRTDIWETLLHYDQNPILGAGFESFWTDERAHEVANLLGLKGSINESHNGYLETYINLGLLGLLFIIALLVATYVKARNALVSDFHFGRFRLAYLVTFIVYNCTEADFRTHCFPFFVFVLCAVDYPRQRSAEVPAEAVVEQDPHYNLIGSSHCDGLANNLPAKSHPVPG